MKKSSNFLKKDNKLIYWSLIFLFGSVIGWIYEECFSLIIEKEVVNRGFMFGPYLPVYGFGALFLVYFLKKLKKHPLIIFVLSILITGITEYITGYLMESIFNRTWWDYTDLFMNIKGYVCLRSVLNFAVLALLLLYLVEPFIEHLSNKYKNQVVVSCISSYIVVLIDLITTLLFRY